MRNKRFLHGKRAVFCSALVGVAMLFLCAEPALSAMRIQSYSAKNHRRFYQGADKDFIGAAYDSSGVGRGFGPYGWATMISDHYFLTAKHLNPTNGQRIRFHHTNDPTEAFEDHFVDSGTRIFSAGLGTDLWVGKLSTVPSTDVARYSVIDLGQKSDYTDKEIYTYGLDSNFAGLFQTLGRNTIDPHLFFNWTVGGSKTLAYTFDYDNPGGVGADESMLIGGDSGGPSFISVGNQLALVGIHWFNSVGGGYSGDSFVPEYISQINTILGASGESLSVIVPEPSSVALIFAAICGLAARRLRA